MWKIFRLSQKTQVKQTYRYDTNVTKNIEARNLPRHKDNNKEKTFLKNDHCDHCNNCDYTNLYSGHLNKHKKGKHDEVKFNCD